jgi:hypothetical protein
VKALTGSDWTTGDYLIANVFDVLQIANWQRAWKKNSPRPKAHYRPGVEDPNQKRITGSSMSVDEMRARLDAINGRR